MDKLHHGQQKPVVTMIGDGESNVAKQQDHPQDPPETDFKFPSCLNVFSTEQNLSRHIHYSAGYGLG